MDWRSIVFGRYPKFFPPAAPGARTRALPGSGEVGEAPYSERVLLGDQGDHYGGGWLVNYVEPNVWPVEMTAGGVASFRVPRVSFLQIGQLAGLSGVDGVNQTAHNMFLPPLRPDQKGATIEAVSGGSNRVSSNSGLNSREQVPAVFVPVH